MKNVPLDQVSAVTFSSFVKTRFRVQATAASVVELELLSVSTPRLSSPAAGKGAQTEHFSLIFQGPGDQPLPQQIHTFEHDQIGRLEIFIVPIGKDKTGFQYEAVFNRVIN